MSSATSAASRTSAIARGWPGTVLTPAASAIRFDSILSPIASMAAALGPMNAMPASSRARTKRAFSDRNPYPGCTASAPVRLQASTMRSIERYDSPAGAGPMWTASSASRTCSARASASEWTATVAIPSRLAVRMIRQAISPRLAIRILLNIAPSLLVRDPRRVQDSRPPALHSLAASAAVRGRRYSCKVHGSPLGGGRDDGHLPDFRQTVRSDQPGRRLADGTGAQGRRPGDDRDGMLRTALRGRHPHLPGLLRVHRAAPAPRRHGVHLDREST